MSDTITLGKSGRLVVPKAIRDRLGLHEGSRLKLEVSGGKLLAEPQPDPVEIVMKDGFPIITSGTTMKRGTIVDAIKADRDSREDHLVKSPIRK